MATAVTIASILTDVGSLVTQTITWMGNWLTAITDNAPLMLACICVPLVGIGIGAIKRLVRIRV